VKTVVLIQGHKEPAIINRMIRAFRHPDISVCVSLDKKSGIGAAEIDPAARFLGAERDIWWGDFSLVQANLDGFAEIHRSEGEYGHLILVSGQDYPVWSNERIVRFLGEHAGRSFLHHAPLAPGGWPEAADRVEYFHYHGPSRVRSLGAKALRGAMRALGLKRALPGGLKPYGGANWFVLSRDAVGEVLAFAAANPAFVDFFRSVAIPDEQFYHTIILNSRLRGTVVNDSHRYVDWSDKLPNPKLLAAADYPAIAASGKMICRKVDAQTSLGLLDLLDAGRAGA
jgi:hypothetical protein